MKNRNKYVALLIAFTISLVVTGCFESKTENAVEDVGESMEENAKEAVDKTKDAADDIGDSMEESAEEVQEKINQETER